MIVFAVPPEALLGQSGLTALALALTGSAGMLFHRRNLVILASTSLIGVMIWGKVATDLLKSRQPDSAVLLAEFITIIFLMEASTVILTFESAREKLNVKKDEISMAQQGRLANWAGSQIFLQGKLGLATILLSLTLLLLGATGVSSNQLAVSGSLVLVAVVLLLFLATYRREPEAK